MKRIWDKVNDEWVYEETSTANSGPTIILHSYPAGFFAKGVKVVKDICETKGKCFCRRGEC